MSSPVAVFDFDDTLVTCDSMSRFSFAYLSARPARALLVLLLLVATLPLFAFKPTLTRGVSLFWWALSFGVGARPLVEALRRFGGGALLACANESIVRELCERVARGETVVVATAAPAVVVRAFLRARDIAGVRIAGTRLARVGGGLWVRPHCFGRTKLVELERRFGLTEWDAAYTDSHFDLPILRAARTVTLVAPSARTRRDVRRALAHDVPVRVL